MKATCCNLGCDALAQYEIRTPSPRGMPGHYTCSCFAHIPDLLTDAVVHEIVRLVAPGDPMPVYR